MDSRRLMQSALIAIATPWLLAAGLPADAQPVRVLAVHVDGNKAVTTDTITKALHPVVRVGLVTTDMGRVLQMAKTKLMRMGYFSSAEVEQELLEGGVTVNVRVRERPRTTSLAFEGNSAMPSDKLAAVVHARPGVFVDKKLLERDAQRIVEAYRDAGLLARVANVHVGPDGQVTFRLRETRLAGIQFEGLVMVTEAEARQALGIDDNAVVARDAIAQGIERLRGKGWFTGVEADMSPGRDANAGDLVLKLTVQERPGVLPDRVGKPKPDIDAGVLRAQISAIRIDIQYEATASISDYLLGVEGDVAQALERATQRAQAPQATADDVREYAEALQAVELRQEAHAQYTRAIAMYEKLLADRPGDYENRLNLGRCLTAADQHNRAQQELRRAVELAPQRWEARVAFALDAHDYSMSQFGQWLKEASSQGTPGAPGASGAFRAVAEMLPWHRTRQAVLQAIGPSTQADALTLLAREGLLNLEQAQKLAPSEPVVLGAVVRIMMGGFLTATSVGGKAPSFWDALSKDTEEFFSAAADVSESDPGLALWSGFFRSLRAVLSLTGVGAPDASEEEVTKEFRDLAAHLTRVVEKWPRALRTSGNMLGLMQFLAGENKLAVDTFEAAIQQNPYDRQNYNALLGVAYTGEDWDYMARIVQRRMEHHDSPTDHVLLGKIAQRMGKAQEALGHFREAMQRFPERPLGYLATAGWLVHLGGSDQEAEQLLAKALQMAPNSGYGLAIKCALKLLEGDAQGATTALSQSLRLTPVDELAAHLRAEFFVAQEPAAN